jgi:hypothetical protein
LWPFFSISNNIETELPIAFAVTPANNDEKAEMLKLLASLTSCHPDIIEMTEYMALDRGYDSTEIIQTLKL